MGMVSRSNTDLMMEIYLLYLESYCKKTQGFFTQRHHLFVLFCNGRTLQNGDVNIQKNFLVSVSNGKLKSLHILHIWDESAYYNNANRFFSLSCPPPPHNGKKRGKLRYYREHNIQSILCIYYVLTTRDALVCKKL